MTRELVRGRALETGNRSLSELKFDARFMPATDDGETTAKWWQAADIDLGLDLSPVPDVLSLYRPITN